MLPGEQSNQLNKSYPLIREYYYHWWRTGEQSNQLNTSYPLIWEYYYHWTPFEGLGETNKLCRTEECLGPVGAAYTQMWRGEQIPWFLSSFHLTLVQDHFYPPNLRSVMYDPPSKNPAASEILCISDVIWSIRTEKYFSICEWPSDMSTGHFHSSRLHPYTVTETYCFLGPVLGDKGNIQTHKIWICMKRQRKKKIKYMVMTLVESRNLYGWHDQTQLYHSGHSLE